MADPRLLLGCVVRALTVHSIPRACKAEGWAGTAEEWIEHIPFDETRAYVKLVLRNLAVYARLYAAS